MSKCRGLLRLSLTVLFSLTLCLMLTTIQQTFPAGPFSQCPVWFSLDFFLCTRVFKLTCFVILNFNLVAYHFCLLNFCYGIWIIKRLPTIYYLFIFLFFLYFVQEVYSLWFFRAWRATRHILSRYKLPHKKVSVHIPIQWRLRQQVFNKQPVSSVPK